MALDFGSGFHAPTGASLDADAYDRYLGRWSRLFVPALLASAKVSAGDRVLDVATGPGEAAVMALPIVENSGLVVGADISPSMLQAAQTRINQHSFVTVAADGQALPFKDGSFDAVVCQLGLQFFPDPSRGLSEFRRILRSGRCAAVCVITEPDRTPMWGYLAEALGRHLPDQRELLHLSFALADAERLEQMFAIAGFGDVHVKREIRQGTIRSSYEYWASIEAGSGMMPQAYRALPEASRSEVRMEVQGRLAPFVSDRGIEMTFEMLIGSGRG
jgi:ubiquinone/menaquinone biosynthesis C-methylase UbiE